MHSPKVCIIVLNWNGIKDTIECIESILCLNYTNYEVVIVDNGSTDMSVETIRGRYPELKILESKQNLGFTGGCNLGIKYAMKKMADYIWILNNDIVIENDCLKKMIDAAENDSQIGLLSPIIFYYHQRNKMQSCGSFFNMKNGRIFADSLDSNEQNTNPNNFVFVLYGTALLIKRELIEKVGFFDDDFFAYFEDYDFSLRANKNAFKNMVVSSAKIYHKDASSTGGVGSPIRTYYFSRNPLLLYKKHLNGIAGLKVKYKHIRKSIGAAFYYRTTGNKLSADACLEGLWDGIWGGVGRKKSGGGGALVFNRVLFFVYLYGKKIKKICKS